MRVSIGLAELVMHSVVSTPHVQRVLACDALADHQEHSQRQLRLVRLVRPQSMSSGRDSQSADHADPVTFLRHEKQTIIKLTSACDALTHHLRSLAKYLSLPSPLFSPSNLLNIHVYCTRRSLEVKMEYRVCTWRT